MSDKRINKISTEAVKKVTGKSWDEWIKLLDKLRTEEMTREIREQRSARKNAQTLAKSTK